MRLHNYFTSLQRPSKYIFVISISGTLLSTILAFLSFFFDYFSNMPGLGILIAIVSFISISASLLALINFTRLKSRFGIVFFLFLIINLVIFYSVYKAIAGPTPF
jgi:hypothetical protein